MKNILPKTLLSIGLVAILLTGCSKDDEDPVIITIDDFATTVDENPALNAELGTIKASVTPDNKLSYSLLKQNPENAMSIDKETGKLSVAKTELFDFETNPVLTAKVVATAGTVSKEAEVSIALNNVTEMDLAENKIEIAIDENQIEGAVLAKIPASVDKGELKYTIKKQSPEGAIAINAATSEIVVADASLFDFETNPTFTATIELSANKVVKDLNVTINLNNVTEITLAKTKLELSCDENQAAKTVIGQIEATVDIGKLTYSIKSQSIKDAIAINSGTGELTVADASAFDFETNPTLTAVIEVACGEVKAEVQVTITLKDTTEWINVPDANFKKALLAAGADINKDGIITATEAAHRTKLYLKKKEISDLTGIEYFINIRELNCDNNALTALDVSRNTKLNKLYCAYNEISSINVRPLSELTTLWVSSNAITELDVSQNSKLTELRCSSNKLKKLDVSNNSLLSFISCGYNSMLSELTLGQTTVETQLHCSSNNLSTLAVSKNSNFTVINCEYNNLSTLDLSNNPKLYHLNCRGNQLKNVNLSKNPLLSFLAHSSNGVETLDLSHNPNLKTLWISSNSIKSLNLNKNTKLTWIDCRYNQLEDLVIDKCNELSILNIERNKLFSLNVLANTKLRELNCKSNRLTSLSLSSNSELIKLDCSNNILDYIGLKNGNNANLTEVKMTGNTTDICIEVDDPTATYLNKWSVNAGVVFKSECTNAPQP